LLLSVAVDSTYHITRSTRGLIRVEFPSTVKKEENILKIITEDEICLGKVTANIMKSATYSNDQAGSMPFKVESTVNNQNNAVIQITQIDKYSP